MKTYSKLNSLPGDLHFSVGGVKACRLCLLAVRETGENLDEDFLDEGLESFLPTGLLLLLRCLFITGLFPLIDLLKQKEKLNNYTNIMG